MADLPITIPILPDVIARVQTDIASEMAGTEGAQDVYLQGTFARGTAKAIGGAATELYGFAARVLGELMPDSAIDWGVARWARVMGVQRIPPQACVASITVTFTGAGTQTLGSTLTRQSDGAEYTLDADVTRGSAGTATGTITAGEAGAASDLDVDDVLVFASPATNVTATTTVSAITTDGADIEALADLKTRVLARLANPPQGGTAADYEGWAQAYDSTIERVWVLEETPYLGAVTVYFAIAGDDAAMVPSGGAATALQTELRAQAPVHSAGIVFAAAPTGRAVDIEVSVIPDNATIQGYVEDELRSFFRSWYGEIDGTGVVLVEDIRAAIRIGAKRYSSTAVYSVSIIDTLPAADVALSAGELPYLGTLTF